MDSNREDPPKLLDNQPVSVTSDVRDELINTAVKFLSNPKVQQSTIEQRESFLRGKGLTEREISQSFERSVIPTTHPVPQQHYHGQPPHTVVPVDLHSHQGYLVPQRTGWGRLREILNTVAIIGGVVYGLYILYKRYIEPFLFGPSKKRSPIEESIASLDATLKASVQELRTDLQNVKVDLDRLNEQQSALQASATARQVQAVKEEVLSLKSILVNRSQFPAIDEKPTIPWIPPWQQDDEDVEESVVKTEEIIDSNTILSTLSKASVPTTNGNVSEADGSVLNGSDSETNASMLTAINGSSDNDIHGTNGSHTTHVTNGSDCLDDVPTTNGSDFSLEVVFENPQKFNSET